MRRVSLLLLGVVLTLMAYATPALAHCWSGQMYHWPVVSTGPGPLAYHVIPITPTHDAPTNAPVDFLVSFQGNTPPAAPQIVADSGSHHLNATAIPVDDHGGWRVTWPSMPPGTWAISLLIPGQAPLPVATLTARSFIQPELQDYAANRVILGGPAPVGEVFPQSTVSWPLVLLLVALLLALAALALITVRLLITRTQTKEESPA